MPRIIASAVMRIGRSRVLPASTTASNGVRRFVATAQVVGETHDQDRIRYRDADRHDRSHQRFDVDRGAGDRQRPKDADQRTGHRHHDDERIDPGLEQDDEHRVDQHAPPAAARNQGCGTRSPTPRSARAGIFSPIDGRSFCTSAIDLLDLTRGAAEVAPVDVRRDVDDTLHGVVTDRLHAGGRTHRGDVGNARHRGAGHRESV